MSDYIDGWDMQDAIGRVADLEAELLKERRAYQEIESQLASVKRIIRHYESMADNFNDDDIRGMMMLRAASDFREALTESEAGDD